MKSAPVALITGASRGIGRSVAVKLAGLGYDLALAARSLSGLEDTGRAAADAGAGDWAAFPADLAADGAGEDLVDAVLERFGRLDTLVNNAGAVFSGSVDDTGAEDWDRMLSLNARSPFLLTRAALPALRRSDSATIVNIGSVVSFKGYENQAAYAASKHALAGWTKVLARELHSEGIRVHLVAPGGVATDLVRQVRPDIDPSTLISPEDIADAVGFLMTYRGNGAIDVLDIRREGKTPFA